MEDSTNYDSEEKTYVQRFLGFFSGIKNSLDKRVEEEDLSTREHLARLENSLFEMNITYRLLERERIDEIETIKTKLAEQNEAVENQIILLKDIIQEEDEFRDYIFSKFDEGLSDNQIFEELIDQGKTIDYIRARAGDMLPNVNWYKYRR